MFNLDQIHAIHEKFGGPDTLPQYLKALHDIGVQTYSSYITDGRSEYFGADGFSLLSEPNHDRISVTDTSNKDDFLLCLDRSEHGELTYPELLEGLAASGIEKWTFDTGKMTMEYSDKSGTVLLSENLADAANFK